MQKILIFTIAFFLSFSSIWAVTSPENDLTSTSFKLDTSAIDPFSSSRSSGVSIEDGTAALKQLIQSFSESLLFFMPIMAGISLMVAGYYYLFSSGDTEKASQAKNIIKWNVIALIVGFLSYILVRFVLFILNLLD